MKIDYGSSNMYVFNVYVQMNVGREEGSEYFSQDLGKQSRFLTDRRDVYIRFTFMSSCLDKRFLRRLLTFRNSFFFCVQEKVMYLKERIPTEENKYPI